MSPRYFHLFDKRGLSLCKSLHGTPHANNLLLAPVGKSISFQFLLLSDQYLLYGPISRSWSGPTWARYRSGWTPPYANIWAHHIIIMPSSRLTGLTIVQCSFFFLFEIQCWHTFYQVLALPSPCNSSPHGL